jgi:hypothetical protein
LDTKDLATLTMAGAALAVSLANFYFSQFHKPSGAMLILLSRTVSPERWQHNSGIFAHLPEKQMVSPAIRHLKYTLSNTGKQALYVKSVDLVQGPDRRGHMKSHHSFIVIPSSHVPPFLLDPGEIHVMEFSHELKHDFGENHDAEKYRYQLVSLEIASADGSRYQICHEVTDLGTAGPDLHHPIWDGTPLGSPVRTSGYF